MIESYFKDPLTIMCPIGGTLFAAAKTFDANIDNIGNFFRKLYKNLYKLPTTRFQQIG